MGAELYNEQNCKVFCDIIIDAATKRPDLLRKTFLMTAESYDGAIGYLLYKLLTSSLPREGKGYALPQEKVYPPDEYSCIQRKNDIDISNPVDKFVYLCKEVHDGNSKKSEKALFRLLRELYESPAAGALLTLLKHVDEDTVRLFANKHLGRDEAAQLATVDIVISKIEDEKQMHGNIGRYIIYTCKDGKKQELNFTNQASAVYYLMFLINRCQMDSLLPYPELSKNMHPFFDLYLQMYDRDATEVYKRFHDLLYRKDKDGKLRAGRLHEIIYDIRKHMEDRFADYGESFSPYVMTAKEHLAIGAEHIQFEGEARQLLKIPFV